MAKSLQLSCLRKWGALTNGTYFDIVNSGNKHKIGPNTLVTWENLNINKLVRCRAGSIKALHVLQRRPSSCVENTGEKPKL